ncbi:MAG: uroporphyrinogen-III synthase [Anaerolineales bacterium]
MSKLWGKRVVVTRPRADFERFARLLHQRGATPICFPIIEIRPVAADAQIGGTLANLERFDWLVFTSSNSVAALKELLEDQAPPARLKLAAVGPTTAEAIQGLGWHVDFMPEDHVSAAILPGLGRLAGKSILLARGQPGSDDLPLAIRGGGGEVTELVVYHTAAVSPRVSDWKAVGEGVDVISFASGSAAKSFALILEQKRLDPGNMPGGPIYAYIGPETAKIASSLNLPLNVIARVHTLTGMLEALENFYQHKFGETDQ